MVRVSLEHLVTDIDTRNIEIREELTHESNSTSNIQYLIGMSPIPERNPVQHLGYNSAVVEKSATRIALRVPFGYVVLRLSVKTNAAVDTVLLSAATCLFATTIRGHIR